MFQWYTPHKHLSVKIHFIEFYFITFLESESFNNIMRNKDELFGDLDKSYWFLGIFENEYLGF